MAQAPVGDAAGVAGGLHAELARRVTAEQVALQDAVLHDVARLRRDAVVVEGTAAQLAGQEGLLADLQPRGKHLATQVIDQEGAAAIQAAAGDRAGEVAEQRGGDPRFEDDRHRGGRDLARAQPAHGALPGAPADLLRRAQLLPAARDAVVVVLLHAARVAGDDGAAQPLRAGAPGAAEAVAVAVGVHAAAGAHARALGVGDARIVGACRLLAAARDLDGLFRTQVPGMEEIERSHLARLQLRLHQPRAGVLAAVTCDGVRRLHRLAQRLGAEIGAAGRTLAAAQVDRDLQRLVALMLQGLQLAHAHGHREARALAVGGLGGAGARRACQGEGLLNDVEGVLLVVCRIVVAHRRRLYQAAHERRHAEKFPRSVLARAFHRDGGTCGSARRRDARRARKCASHSGRIRPWMSPRYWTL